jgi:hypothetical protein
MNKFAQIAWSLGCFLLVAGSMSSSAQAVEKDLSRCSAVIQFEPYLGDQCVTASNVTFTRVWNAKTQATGWKNDRTGQIWFEQVALGVDHFEATAFCASHAGQTLPSGLPEGESDLRRGLADGVLELFPTVRGHALWSGTLASNNGEEAYWLDTSKGVIEPFYRTHKGKTAAVCVSVAAPASR